MGGSVYDLILTMLCGGGMRLINRKFGWVSPLLFRARNSGVGESLFEPFMLSHLLLDTTPF